MKKHDELQKTFRGATQNELLTNTAEIGPLKKSFKHLKKYLYIGGLAGIGLLFNGCFPGYISSEPTYVETSRPSSPSNVHVWVDGNWAWNRHSGTYEHRDGYWSKPHQNRKYTAGHWNSTPKGHRWVDGHWSR
jgi:hypothetical protein